ncbi:hypothetical protein D5F52_04210 [Brevibacillus laterosporus]|nr:hypothetical protein D5F52_04210 [Brevibacillus laterosporus]MBM7111332.1 hypothetical protein [Brevibacillus laterosporus]
MIVFSVSLKGSYIKGKVVIYEVEIGKSANFDGSDKRGKVLILLEFVDMLTIQFTIKISWCGSGSVALKTRTIVLFLDVKVPPIPL